MDNQQTYTTDYVTSKDGTKIGYRRQGRGPGLVILHGGMQAAQNFTGLAAELANEFTLYIPDRRGRGLSGPCGENYGLQKECEDLEALLVKTGACYVFGLSSGAVIALYGTLHLPAIRKAALYEPPFEAGPVLNTFIQRYEREIADGKIASALITVLKGLSLSPLLNAIPRFLLQPLFNLSMLRDGKGKQDDVPLKALVPTFHYDNVLVQETEGTLASYANVRTKILLMGGGKSPAFLISVLRKLAEVLPRARSIDFPSLDHSGPDDGGKPAMVAAQLRRFFHESD
ncbi:alpha/beta hydrolase [Paenibacillus rhizovicinus]|uniref:Alpha/beta hydrolase n=1 Tax=Paenibacillus rhizovicinus TaxID=2704463 RepID=A0A6C0NWC2_9BACL|nr:alpha/beta hydrolase [Paenibacillus rhizovicinus]QHW30505.1 alpha/beta hydrolase [Paenibacillus rhizovicinus]